jgi:hypothetical protein
VRDLDHNLVDSDDLQPGQSYSFTFCGARSVQIGDHRGSAWATITVTSSPVTPTPTPSPSPGATSSNNSMLRVDSIQRAPSGDIVLRGFGVPARVHAVEEISELDGQHQVVGFVTADAQGALVYEGVTINPDVSFYRFVVQ